MTDREEMKTLLKTEADNRGEAIDTLMVNTLFVKS